MEKKTLYNCAYLRVDVSSPWKTPPYIRKDWEGSISHVIADIQRHCDGVEDITVIDDTEDVCEFCGYAWTEGNDPHNGGCCEEDAKTMEVSEAS